MGLFRRRAAKIVGQGRPFESGLYDSVEAFFTNSAVMSALMCTLALADRWNVVPSDYSEMTFRLFMCSYSAFRTFVVQTMRQEDVGVHREELFSCTVVLGDQVFDACETVLQSKFTADMFSAKILSSYDDCLGDPNFESASEHLFEHFPVAKMNIWIRLHPETHDILTGLAIRSETLLCWASVLLVSAVITSVLAITSLSLSPAKWDIGSFELMMCYWGPSAVVAFAMMVAGIILFFMGHQQALLFKTPFYKHAKTSGDVAMNGWLIPCLSLFGILAIVSPVQSYWRLRNPTKESEQNSGVQATQD
eukprot:gnl/TRDRNA2_/TRDRNA2_169432_c0_seq2.p1 gnl/TRDRNA2_/TRDRNA2_169432_c0~~gnl/TRDRNA2_/TRDRNA2_169432_c0_seq2.p1  ORF type:complete len:306 (-),score=25.00 gnl/TRDRNA2_/TRDRNA2_169432_c0_seq2:305-1222(-)